MDDAKAILGAVMLITAFLCVGTFDFKEKVVGTISDPEKNERIAGLLEKACMNTGYECRHLVAGQ